MRDIIDISGVWDGVFTYPQNALPTTPFLAEISDRAGALTGQTREPSLYGSSAAQAVLVGYRSGQSIDFTKTYDRTGEGYESPVDYVGRLSSDGDTIVGSWTMQDWSGTFEMTRNSLSIEEQQFEHTVEVD